MQRLIKRHSVSLQGIKSLDTIVNLMTVWANTLHFWVYNA